MFKAVITYFDKLEDRVRIKLSRNPIIYAIIGGVGIVLFWKGVWETAEYFPILHGPGSITLGVAILLVSGLLVASFIGDSIIMSGYKKEKKLVEKTEAELADERNSLEYVVAELDEIENEIEAMKKQCSDERIVR